MKLTELVEALVEHGDRTEEPDPVVRVLVDGRWYIVERVFVDYGDESIVMFVNDASVPFVPEPPDQELEHWP